MNNQNYLTSAEMEELKDLQDSITNVPDVIATYMLPANSPAIIPLTNALMGEAKANLKAFESKMASILQDRKKKAEQSVPFSSDSFLGQVWSNAVNCKPLFVGKVTPTEQSLLKIAMCFMQIGEGHNAIEIKGNWENYRAVNIEVVATSKQTERTE